MGLEILFRRHEKIQRVIGVILRKVVTAVFVEGPQPLLALGTVDPVPQDPEQIGLFDLPVGPHLPEHMTVAVIDQAAVEEGFFPFERAVVNEIGTFGHGVLIEGEGVTAQFVQQRPCRVESSDPFAAGQDEPPAVGGRDAPLFGLEFGESLFCRRFCFSHIDGIARDLAFGNDGKFRSSHPAQITLKVRCRHAVEFAGLVGQGDDACRFPVPGEHEGFFRRLKFRQDRGEKYDGKMLEQIHENDSFFFLDRENQ